MSNHLFAELHPPPGRRANREAVASYWQRVDAGVKQAAAEVEAARKQAAKMPDDRHFADQLARAEDNLLGVQGEAKMARRKIIEDVERGRDGFTVEAPLTPEQQLAAEERRDRIRADAEHAHGLPSASPVERELRQTQRELRRLRAQLAGE